MSEKKKSDLGKAVAAMWATLLALEEEDRPRALAALRTMLGGALEESEPPLNRGTSGGVQANSRPHGITRGAREFFDAKNPESKLEMLAVAARFRELNNGGTTHSRDELRDVFVQARRNFDAAKFRFDIANAKNKGFFNRGRESQLSYAGQNFVDALPKREEALKQLSRRGRKSRRKARKSP